MKGAILHVGANTASDCLGWPGPLHEDGSFVFVPIPERSEYRDYCPTYRGLGLEKWVPPEKQNSPVHTDPDFNNFTYGDYLRTSNGRPKARVSAVHSTCSWLLHFFYCFAS